MYKLLKPIPNGLTQLVEEVQSHITNIGLEAVKGLKGDNVRIIFIMLNLTRIHSYAIILN